MAGNCAVHYSCQEPIMPIYEYRCADCRRRVSIWWRTFGEAASGQAECPRCGGTRLSRLVSRVAVLRSEESHLDDLADPSAFGDLDENDPRSMGRWMRRMSAEMGEDLGEEFSEVVDRLEAGESPESIEQSMPDLGAGDDVGLSDFD
jgi:putative FmdB family regulatory protein